MFDFECPSCDNFVSHLPMSVESSIVPRISSSLFPKFIGRPVRLPCKFLSWNQGKPLVEAGDGGRILITGNVESLANPESKFLEIVGNVVDDKTLRGLSLISLGNEFDLAMANQVNMIMLKEIENSPPSHV
ncbi:hypothetical protein C8J56DRAFT_1021817 [Mycena floridula]|nr:hypothetical protein C8J56DRAFT_1021817 [Mycena floridula]